MRQIEKVSIALQPNVYTTFRALNNTVSFAFGEYVDNSLQSYLNNKEILFNINPNYKLEVRINVDWEKRTITITDNAAGISFKSYEKAFQPAHIPIDRTGLNEFGMGMKTASVWLADNWCVYTKALGESVERYTEFDLKKVIKENKEELIVTENEKPESEHYTRIILSNLSDQAPSVNQMDKIKRHLSSFYRKYIRSNEIDIFVNDELLSYPEYEILSAPYYKTPDGKEIFWKKEIDFELGEYKAKGFIGILKTMQQAANGIALLRRGRIIEEKYFPKILCGQVGSPRYKRIFGEIELEGFEVSFNKNKFRDEENLEVFISALKDELTNVDFDLYGQAEYYRQRAKEEINKIAKGIVKGLEKETKPRKLTRKMQDAEMKIGDAQQIKKSEESILAASTISTHSDFFQLNGDDYTIKVDLVEEQSSDKLYSVVIENNDSLFDTENNKTIVCKINLAHSFFTHYDMFKKANNYQPIVSVFKALALAEVMAPNRGTTYASNIRLLFNNYIVE